MRIVILDGYTANPGDLNWEGFKADELVVYDRTSVVDHDEIIARIGDAEAVLTNKTPLSADIIEACPSIRYVGVLATGYNVVDTDAARAKGIPVTNVPAYGTDAVAQMVFALLLEVCHHVAAHSDAVYNGGWTSSVDWCFWNYPLIGLSGKTMGIVGFGNIGQKTGTIAKAMGMNVLAYDERQTAVGCDIGEYVELNELFRRSDIISLHCPLLPATEGIINKTSIAEMKDGVILINTARGPLVDEQALADALNSGKVYAAAVDVVSVEPISANNPLLSVKNCIITPHISWASKESRARLIDIAANNFMAFLSGNPVNVVNL